MTGYLVNVRIVESARKHGIRDEDTRHAVRLAIAEWRLDDNLTMCVGPARTGHLLEVGVLGIDSDDDEPVIVHAMLCRDRYLPRKP
jgi:hypothetical protein